MDLDATVFVLDDDNSFGQALGRLLRAEGFRVRTWTSAAAFLAQHEPETVGCLLANLLMPEMSGLELQHRLLEQGSQRPIVFITDRGDISSAVQGMRAGAVSVLPKPVKLAVLMGAIEEALAQDVNLRSAAHERQRMLDVLASLTPREREVLKFVVRGYLNKQIAAELGTAEKTIKVHRGRLMRKLQTRSMTTLVQIVNLCEGDVTPRLVPHRNVPSSSLHT